MAPRIPLPTLVLALAGTAAAAPASGQEAPPPAGVRTEQVTYQNPDDGMALAGALTLPPGDGPFPAVALLSIADTEGLVGRLASLGFAVLRPERRGMTATDRLLDASYQDLADDARAALALLASRPEVDREALGLLGQGDDSPAALLAGVGSPPPAFLILVSTTGLPGTESFGIEQRRLGEERRWSPEALDALDGYVERLAVIVLDDISPAARAVSLTALLESGQGLPRSAAFPLTAEGQALFFGSRVWHDRLAFQPAEALARVSAPVLVLTGLEDVFTPVEAHLPPIRRALEAAPSGDVTVCVLPGRTRHAFSPEALDVIGRWLAARAGRERGGPAGREAPEACLDEGEVPG